MIVIDVEKARLIAIAAVAIICAVGYLIIRKE